MSKRSAEDTIAGYYYQFDKTILDVLALEDHQSLVVEGIEDIDIEDLLNDGVAVQCKYHAKTKYNPSNIKKPVQKLLKEYIKDRENGGTLKFRLYAHFKENTEALTEKLEDKCLRNDQINFLKDDLLSGKRNGIEYCIYQDHGIDDATLLNFMQNLEFDISAKNIEDQGKDVIEAIRKIFDNCDYRVAENYYYNNALKVVFQLAIQGEEENRRITKEDFILKVDKRKFLFNKWFAHLQGKRRYIDFIKENLRKTKALARPKHKFLFIDSSILTSPSNELSVTELCKNIIDEFYQYGVVFAKKSCPWTIVFDCDDEQLNEYKKQLTAKSITYNAKDTIVGFNIDVFNSQPVVNTSSNGKLTSSSYQIRLITFQDFQENQKKIKDIDVSIFVSNQDFNSYFLIGDGDSSTPINRGMRLFVVEPDDKVKTIDDLYFLFDEVLSGSDYLRILTVKPDIVEVEVLNPIKFKQKNESFSIGSFLKIDDEGSNSMIGILRSYKIKDASEKHEEIVNKDPSFILEIQILGFMKGDKFRRGGHEIAIPPSDVSVADSALLKQIFTLGHEKNRERIFSFGTLSYDNDVDVVIDGNNFFNKHIAIVGSTGSGKSCTVAKVLQASIEQNEKQIANGNKNNSRIIIFDLHGEYKSAFPSSDYYSTDSLKLPYWLMNGEELAEMFIDSSEFSSHNQYNQLKEAITLNKKVHNPDFDVTFDSPVYFSLTEVTNYIRNLNKERIYSASKIPAIDGVDPDDFRPEMYFDPEISFVSGTGTKTGRFPDFDRFLTRLESKLDDDRLKFIINSGEELKSEHLSQLILQFLGKANNEVAVNDQNNVCIIDLSGISFEVLSLVVSLISRLMFNFMYHSKKVDENDQIHNPILMVYEEAHNYIPQSNIVKYRAVKESIERISKEGRKYGICSMIVSQRPSEISETIFSQCNSFMVMRLTNPTDQSYVKRLLPDSISSITDNLSGLESQEVLLLGSAIPIPTIVKVNKIADHILPRSTDIDFMEKWKGDRRELTYIEDVINKIMPPRE